MYCNLFFPMLKYIPRGGVKMKAIKFGDGTRDKSLVENIEKFKNEKHIGTFIEAVRVLCERALSLNEITK